MENYWNDYNVKKPEKNEHIVVYWPKDGRLLASVANHYGAPYADYGYSYSIDGAYWMYKRDALELLGLEVVQ